MFSLGLGLALTRAGAAQPVDVVIFDANFGALAPGPTASPAGITYARASAATTLHPLIASPAASGYTSDLARVATLTTGDVALLLEGGTSNVLSSDTPWLWSGGASGGSSTTQDAVTTDPAGVAGCALHSILSGGNSKFENVAAGATLATEYVATVWAKGSAAATYQVRAYDGATSHASYGSLTGGWDHLAVYYVACGTTRALVLADGSDQTALYTGTTAGARTYRTSRHQIEASTRASSWIAPGTTRAGASCTVADLVRAGRLAIELEWIAPYDSDKLPWSPCIWARNGEYAEIDRDSTCIRLWIGGAQYWVSGPNKFTRGQRIKLRLDSGNGPTYGSITIAGVTHPILDGRILPALAGSHTVDVGCNGTALQLEGGHIRWRAFASPRRPSVVQVSDVASLRTWAAIAGPRVVQLAAGTYRIASPVSLASGVALAPAPGASVAIDGGALIAGAWSGPDVNGVYTIAYAGTVADLWVNGIRATRARSGLNPGGWSWNGNGTVTAASGGEAAKVGIGGRVSARRAWRHFLCGVTGVSGATLTVDATQYADATTIAAVLPNVIWWAEGPGYVGDAEGYYWHDGATLSYKPRVGETMGVVEVVVGVAEQAFTAQGTLDAPVTDVSIAGLTVKHCTWTDGLTSGASALQDGVLVRTAASSGYLLMPVAIQGYAARRMLVTGCTLAGCGATWIGFLYGSQECAALDNDISDAGAGGVGIGDVTHLSEDPWPSDSRAILSNNVVANCKIRDVGATYRSSVAIRYAYAPGTVLSTNDCDAAADGKVFYYSVFHGGWAWGYNDPINATASGWPVGVTPAPVVDTPLGHVRIARNRITAFLQGGLQDGGGIYMMGAHGNGGRSLVVENFVEADNADAATSFFALYGDQGLRETDFYRNSSNSTGGDGWMFFQPNVTPYALKNRAMGNFATNGGVVTAPDDRSFGNTVGAFGSTALAIKAAAGRKVA